MRLLIRVHVRIRNVLLARDVVELASSRDRAAWVRVDAANSLLVVIVVPRARRHRLIVHCSLVSLVLVSQVWHRHAISRVLFRNVNDTAAVVASLAHAATFGAHLPSTILVLE